MPLVDNVWYIDFGNGSTTGYYSVPAWSAAAAKVCGTLVRQLAAPAVNSERIFACIASTSGTGTTGGAEPAWVLTRGAKTTDNTVTWMEATGIAALNGDFVNTPNWTAIKNTAILLGQVIQNGAGTLVLICTTAGTAGNGAEPSWAAFTNAGATTSDNTVTWTNLGPLYTNWAAPHARLQNAYAATWGQAGNSFWVASEHAETQSSGASISAPNGSASAITSTYCVNKSNVPPGSANLTTGATLNTTGASSLNLGGLNAYFYGLTLNAGNAANNAGITIGNSSASTFENCSFSLNNTGATSLLSLASTSGAVMIKNCTITFGSTNHQMVGAGAASIIQNLTLSGSVPTTLFNRTNVTSGLVIVKGSDLSTITGTLVGDFSGTTVFQDCKLAGGVTVVGSMVRHNSYLDLIRCDSGATNYRNERYRVSGTQTTETTIVRSGGATDGVTPISWKIVTSSGARWVFPFESQPIAIWNDITGVSKTVTIFGIWGGGAVPNNDDIWVEVEYPGSALTPISSFTNDSKSNALATGSPQTSDSSTWGGSTTAFQLNMSFTPQMKGPFNIVVKCAKPSTTFYIDPLAVVV